MPLYLKAINTIITVFLSLPGNITRRLSVDRTSEVSAMTEVNFASADRKKSYYCIYCLDMLKIYLKETKLFEFP